MSLSIKYINLYYFYSLYKSYGTKVILIPLKSSNSFHFVIWPGCTEPPQQTRCNPSLANEVHLVMARHPGASFPVNHPQEAIPKSANDRLSPSLSWSSLFETLTNRGLAGGTIFSMCTRVRNLEYAMMFYMFYIHY